MNLKPPMYHKADLKFIEDELSKTRYDVRYRVSRIYSCIILRILHEESDAVKTANRARKEANTWLRTMSEKYPLREKGS